MTEKRQKHNETPCKSCIVFFGSSIFISGAWNHSKCLQWQTSGSWQVSDSAKREDAAEQPVKPPEACGQSHMSRYCMSRYVKICQCVKTCQDDFLHLLRASGILGGTWNKRHCVIKSYKIQPFRFWSVWLMFYLCLPASACRFSFLGFQSCFFDVFRYFMIFAYQSRKRRFADQRWQVLFPQRLKKSLILWTKKGEKVVVKTCHCENWGPKKTCHIQGVECLGRRRICVTLQHQKKRLRPQNCSLRPFKLQFSNQKLMQVVLFCDVVVNFCEN